MIFFLAAITADGDKHSAFIEDKLVGRVPARLRAIDTLECVLRIFYHAWFFKLVNNALLLENASAFEEVFTKDSTALSSLALDDRAMNFMPARKVNSIGCVIAFSGHLGNCVMRDIYVSPLHDVLLVRTGATGRSIRKYGVRLFRIQSPEICRRLKNMRAPVRRGVRKLDCVLNTFLFHCGIFYEVFK